MSKKPGFALRGELRLKNSRLIEERQKLNMSQKDFAEALSISYVTYNAYENLREYPSKKHRRILCEFCCCEEAELFPPQLKEYAEKKEARILVSTTIVEPSRLLSMNRKEVLSITSGDESDESLDVEMLKRDLDEALSHISPRDERVIRSFYGLGCPPMSVVEIGFMMGVIPERVKQLRERALRRLGSVETSQRIRQWLNSVDGLPPLGVNLTRDEEITWDNLSDDLRLRRKPYIPDLIY